MELLFLIIFFAVCFGLLVLSIYKIYTWYKRPENNLKYNQYQNEKIIFKRSENFIFEPNEPKRINLKEPMLYKASINYGFIILFIAFVVLGIFGTYWAKNEENFTNQYIPLIFTLYGIIMLIKTYTTKYTINGNSVDIYSGTTKYVIPYEKILEVEKRVINPFFRHGKKGRIRAETNSKVLLINFIDSKDNIRVIMISPEMQDLFVHHLILKIK